MSYATNIGKAISLRTPERSDYWLRRAADDLKLQKQEEAKAKAAQAEKLATIYDIDLKGGYLPAWGKAAKQKYADYVNSVAELRAQDPNVSYAKLIMLKNETKAQIENLKLYSDGVKAYISNAEYAHDPNWVKAAYESEDFNEIAKHNNPTYYNVVPETGYTFLNPVKVVTPNIQWGDQKQEDIKERVSRGGVLYDIMQRDYPSETSKAISSELKLNEPYREFIAWKLTQNPEYKKRPDEDLAAWSSRITPLVDDMIDKEVEKSKPPAYTYPKAVPGQGKGGGGKKLYDAEMTTNETLYARPKDATSKTNIPIAAKPVKVTNSINLTSNGYFRLVDNFDQTIPKEYNGKTLSFNFRPNKIVSINVRGVKRLYAQGSILAPDSEEATDFVSLLNKGLPPDQQIKVTDKTKWASAQNILVPYEGSVKSLIKAENNTQSIEDYDIVGETEKIFKSQKGGGAYSSAQEQGIKNVMERNGISRDEAIRALKAAGKL